MKIFPDREELEYIAGLVVRMGIVVGGMVGIGILIIFVGHMLK